jgi:hypothetical protein
VVAGSLACTVTVAALSLLAAAAGMAHAGVVPDSSGIAGLRTISRLGDRTRITTGHGVFEVDRPLIDSTGVAIESGGRPAIVVAGEPRPLRMASWSEIESIHMVRGRAATYMLGGMLVGAALGGLMVAINGPDAFESGDHAIVAFAGVLTLTGGALGALIGFNYPKVERVYP